MCASVCFKSLTKLIKRLVPPLRGLESRADCVLAVVPLQQVTESILHSSGAGQRKTQNHFTTNVDGSILTDGVDGGNDGDDGTVVVMVIEDVQHRGPLSSNACRIIMRKSAEVEMLF